MASSQKLVRLPDWDNRLNAYMAEARRQHWGAFDCARFVSGAVEAMTGTNPHQIDYMDRATAAQALRDCGAKTLHNYMRRWFGNPIKNTALARRGDLVQLNTDEGKCFGVIASRAAWFLSDDEFVKVSPLTCDLVWRVGQ